MGFEITRPLFLGAGVLALIVIVTIWRVFPPPLPRRRARISLGLRALIVVLLTASLAGFQVQTAPSTQSLLVVADLSASVQSALDSEATMVRGILQQRQGDNRAGVLSFGRDPQVEVNISKDPQFGEFQSQPNKNYTDIASALQLGGSILPDNSRRHIVLISDGRGNLGDAVGEARLLRSEGVRVDTIALPVPLSAEVYVDRLDAPRTITQGQQATAQALIVSNTVTAATVRWYLDRTLVNTVQLDLPVAVGCAHHRDLDVHVAQSGDALGPASFDGGTALELEAEFGEELDGGIDVRDHDTDVVHALDRHDVSLASALGAASPRFGAGGPLASPRRIEE